jgi:hypothetical protein
MLHGLRPGQKVFCKSVDDIDAQIPNRPVLHEFYTVRANCMGRGILLEEVQNETVDGLQDELGFPQSCFVLLDNERIKKITAYLKADSTGTNRTTVSMELSKSKSKYEKMSEMRWDKKKEIATKLELLQSDLEDYLEIWKKTGGGTTGHAIGSMIARIQEKRVFFENYC